MLQQFQLFILFIIINSTENKAYLEEQLTSSEDFQDQQAELRSILTMMQTDKQKYNAIQGFNNDPDKFGENFNLNQCLYPFNNFKNDVETDDCMIKPREKIIDQLLINKDAKQYNDIFQNNHAQDPNNFPLYDVVKMYYSKNMDNVRKNLSKLQLINLTHLYFNNILNKQNHNCAIPDDAIFKTIYRNAKCYTWFNINRINKKLNRRRIIMAHVESKAYLVKHIMSKQFQLPHSVDLYPFNNLKSNDGKLKQLEPKDSLRPDQKDPYVLTEESIEINATKLLFKLDMFNFFYERRFYDAIRAISIFGLKDDTIRLNRSEDERFFKQIIFNHQLPQNRKGFDQKDCQNQIYNQINLQSLQQPMTYRPQWKHGVVLENNNMLNSHNFDPQWKTISEESMYLRDANINTNYDNQVTFRNKSYIYNPYGFLYDTGLIPEFRQNKFDIYHEKNLKNEEKDQFQQIKNLDLQEIDQEISKFSIQVEKTNKFYNINFNKYMPTIVVDVPIESYENILDEIYELDLDQSNKFKKKEINEKINSKTIDQIGVYDEVQQRRQVQYSKNLTNSDPQLELVDPRIFPESDFKNLDFQKQLRREFISQDFAHLIMNNWSQFNHKTLKNQKSNWDNILKISHTFTDLPYHSFRNFQQIKTIPRDTLDLDYTYRFQMLPLNSVNSMMYQNSFSNEKIYSSQNTWTLNQRYKNYRFDIFQSNQYNRRQYYYSKSMIRQNEFLFSSRSKEWQGIDYQFEDQNQEQLSKMVFNTMDSSKLLHNQYNVWADKHRFDLDKEDFLNQKFIAQLPKKKYLSDNFRKYKDKDQAKIQPYIIDFTQLCNMKNLINKIYNKNLTFDSIGNLIYSITNKIRIKKTSQSQNSIILMLDKREQDIFRRLVVKYISNEYPIKDVKNLKQNAFHCFNDQECQCNNINKIDIKETIKSQNVQLKHLNDEFKNEDFMNQYKQQFMQNSKVNKELQEFNQFHDYTLFSNASCILSEFDFILDQTNKDSFKEYHDKIYRYYLSHVYAQEWFVVCGEGLFTEELTKECDDGAECKRCDMNMITQIWDSLTELICQYNIFQKHQYSNIGDDKYKTQKFFENRKLSPNQDLKLCYITNLDKYWDLNDFESLKDENFTKIENNLQFSNSDFQNEMNNIDELADKWRENGVITDDEKNYIIDNVKKQVDSKFKFNEQKDLIDPQLIFRKQPKEMYDEQNKL